MIELSPHRQGVCLRVRAQAGARSNELRGLHNGELKVAVTPAPEKGKANRAIQDLLCQELDLRRSQVTLISGHTSHHKTFLIRDCPPAALRLRIQRAVAPNS